MWAGRLDDDGNEEEAYAGADRDVKLLDMAVADLQLTAEERGELRILAFELGPDDRAIARATGVLNGLIDAAVEDSSSPTTSFSCWWAAEGFQFQLSNSQYRLRMIDKI